MRVDETVLLKLFEVIKTRKSADPESSYTARLFAKGINKIAQKLGEEAVETAIAAVVEERLYHEAVVKKIAVLAVIPQGHFHRLALANGRGVMIAD